MNKIRPVAVLGLGVASMALLPNVTAQAATTCQGKPATIEASSGKITGTAGDDVIVARAKVVRVDSGEGDDVICVVKNLKSSASRMIDIDAGPGDDTVDTSRAGAGSNTTLGAGADRFLGSSLREYVDVDEGDGGPDRVRTGGGRDRVRVARGVVVNARLGAGHDELELFTHYSDSPLTGPGAVVRAQLGAGDDVVRFNTSYAGPGSEFLMGPGSDGVGFHDDWEVAGAGETSLVADLAEGLVTWHDVTSAVRDAENLSVTARTVDVRGNSSGNHFFSMGCDVTFRGGAGEDWITMRSHTIADQQPFSCEPGDVKTAFGDAGPDHLFGWRTHDELFGGPGRDRAHGGSGGDDVCIAEIVAGKGCGRPS